MNLAKIYEKMRGCTKCDLWRTRTHVVVGDGIPNKIMFVGEAPGKYEDLQGKPFVGSAGKLLSELLESIGLTRDDIYITNVVKCRPPYNRVPTSKEIDACSPYLKMQISIIKPKVICLLGSVALYTLLRENLSVSKVHGTTITKDNIIYFPMYHPAAALYQKQLVDTMKNDMKNLKKIILSVC